MEDNNQLNTSQHGFRSGRSCLSQLLEHFDHITRLLEEGKSVDIIYLDFAKAFDKVDIGVTLRKLKTLGVSGKLGRWLQCFLTDRTQAVAVNGTKSDPVPVLSGVPQGSVLGPLLFLILIGDIDKNITSSFLSSFADDTRVGHSISSDSDTTALQKDLQTVYDWAESNNMQFNSDKFEFLHYKTQNFPNVSTKYVADNGSPIEEKSSLRDLGITMTNDASFSKYIVEKVATMKSKIAWVLRTFRTREALPMCTLWKQLILSDHDYCSQLWSPDKVGDIQSLELLQRSFLRKINSIHNLSYWDQLKQLKMYSLERRRERYISIYVWRILENQVPNISRSCGITAAWHGRRGRLCHVPKILSSAPARVKTIRFSSFAIKGPRLFNSLPIQLRNFTDGTVMDFKRNLDRYLQSLPDEPLIPGYTSFRTIDSNSIVDWSTHFARHQPEVPAWKQLQQAKQVDLPGSP